MPYNCQTCRINVDRDGCECTVGNSWDGKKWSWDLCCNCHARRKEFCPREWYVKESCTFCFQKSGEKLSRGEQQLRDGRKQELMEEARLFEPWKQKGFAYIPFDLALSCYKCRNSFIFTVGEQEFYMKKGFSRPRKCTACRALKGK